MKNPKYVIAMIGMFGDKKAFIINNSSTHDSLPIRKEDIVSAGFFSWDTQKDLCGNDCLRVKTFGKSVSLGVESREEDNIYIEKIFNYWE